jgi:ribosomal protein S18 acetylase RimI-like enzyme
MQPVDPPIIVPRKDQGRAIASTLAKAFVDYPLFMYAIPDPSRRGQSLQVLFEVMITYTMKYGKIYATSDQLEGVMCCLPSEATVVSKWGMIKSGAIKVPLKMGFQFIRRQERVHKVLESLRAKHAPFPHTYLWNIGVNPALKGRGHGGRLIRHLLHELAAKNEPCYLETALERNAQLYEHLGFKVMEKHEIPALKMTKWAMLWKKEW